MNKGDFSTLSNRSVVLVGLMGSGKSSVGRRLAKAVDIPFVDADSEIERAAGCTIEEIFARFGESAFRDGERRVMERLLAGSPQVIATGGGAFVNEETRNRIKEAAVSVWLRADLDVLVTRTAGKGGRPLLKNGNPRDTLKDLMDRRHPVYAEADIIVDTMDETPDSTTEKVIKALLEFLGEERGQAERPARTE
ncbi:MAG: shikimate kinase [Rhodospirillales bacterium]|nr:shikimate kinase [Rhodospirillales bacterium]MCW8861324.1 shikimate kinase [Rhodospirillales bacterium]MCW8951078.1 shikimate kinase [Rhodospirillales bacterium]MCW8971221.1 shikimate kinase [Rhodospirillales bacterium]MCW9001087.1 shikimate kinase [Rhodospirillales bacterium]